ncbi:MAG: alpha/beta fold hydrolase [Thermoleophilaceae bacterium]
MQHWFPGRSGAKAAVKLATRPDRVARRGLRLAAELARIAAGRSEVAPAKGDRRFKDPAWTGNPAFQRLGQSYLATGAALDTLLSDAGLDWQSERRVRFAAENLVDLLAPSNFPATNPAVLKAVLDTGGRNFTRGLAHFVKDMAKRPRVPSMVDSSAFEVGDNLAVTKGAVVLRTDVFELIQYEPQTTKVREAPLLVVPPMINKFYVTDLAPGRSLIEHLVKSGQQVFAISWRNPDERHSDWNLETYAGAIVEALDAVERITKVSSTHLLGLCAGGIVLSAVLAHLSQTGAGDRIAGATLAVTVLDTEQAGLTGAFMDRGTAALAIAESARRGYLDGRALAGVFAWLRPNDLIWNYWVNNYLLGKNPPAFDVLFWNSDTTRMPAGLHRDFIELSLDNKLTHPGSLTVLGTPVDLSKITADSYVVAGISDHITPWQNCYKTTGLLGSEPRFVLSTSGHIAAMVNPPGNEKSSYQTNTENPPDADDWMRGAATKRGTWWDDWIAWLGERSGSEKRAPRKLGAAGFDPIMRAPGSYVLEQ